ncbi:shewanella-like protein phosphatase 1, putative [Plasmodium ovale wallikeri]|uniref:Shewanella-like protein phosphatase 1, putative n=2 Tax=Plasmodium ovale TaxID=36330 RepID=A0A1A8ZCS6_PLAOA|nr:shewanella-like protein phosphatase 1, putative [Plasmodium ovale wallikeri]
MRSCIYETRGLQNWYTICIEFRLSPSFLWDVHQVWMFSFDKPAPPHIVLPLFFKAPLSILVHHLGSLLSCRIIIGLCKSYHKRGIFVKEFVFPETWVEEDAMYQPKPTKQSACGATMNKSHIGKMTWGAKICALLLLYGITAKNVERANMSKNDFVFKNLAIDKKKLDSSYFQTYDNIQWDGKIIAIGDIHGDMESLKLILRHANLVNEKDEWIGENVLLVQVGDVLDRGIYGPLIYDYLFQLQKDAIHKKSKIILILGNHEQLNLCGYFDYVNRKEVEIFFQNNYHYRLYSFVHEKGEYYKKLIRLPPIVKVNNIIFTHAGLSYTMSKFNINTICLKTRLQIENGCKLLNYDKSHNYVSREGVLWHDVISRKVQTNQKEGCSDLRKILKKFNTKRLVVGHTRQLSHTIKSFCNNRYFLIDTGMSLFMNSGQPFPNYLLIEDGKIKSVQLIVQQKNKKKECPTMEISLTSPQETSYCIDEKFRTLVNEHT